MKATKLGALLKGIGVTSRPETLISSVVTDSRKAEKGSLFVAIIGDRLDGNDFIKRAYETGAEAALVSRPDADCPIEQIVVSDTRDALIEMAGNYRSRFEPKTAAITGSVGKTTTKEMIAAIFSEFGVTLKNEGNQNNEVGLPATLFNMDDDTELAVIEMGMSNLGDIRKLTNAVRPQAAVITAIGVAHIEHLGTRENILKAKLEVVEGMPKNGVLVINGDDELLLGARGEVGVETASFALNNSDADVTAKGIMTRDLSTEFTICDRISGSFPAMIPAIGTHNILDAIAGYTLATRMGLDPFRSAKALSNYRSSGMRQKFVEFDGVTVIEDCYNANPDSMKASLEMLAGLSVTGIKVAVLGDMLELGDISRDAHKSLGIEAARCCVDVLLCYGEQMKLCAESAKAAGVPCVEHFESKTKLAKYLAKTVRAGDAVIFKASRGLKLEDVIEQFYKLH